MCGSLSITTLLANEFNVQNVLYGQVSLAAVSQLYVVHEVMNACKKYKDSLRAGLENVDIVTSTPNAGNQCVH